MGLLFYCPRVRTMVAPRCIILCTDLNNGLFEPWICLGRALVGWIRSWFEMLRSEHLKNGQNFRVITLTFYVLLSQRRVQLLPVVSRFLHTAYHKRASRIFYDMNHKKYNSNVSTR